MYNSERYERQILMPQLGEHGQEKLKNSSVLIVGAGGLGCPAAAYLAGSGIGKIDLIDNDEVSFSNLHRQILHTTDRVGMNKAESARLTLEKINEDIEIISYPFLLTQDNAKEIIAQYDFVIDAVDNFETKFLINSTCVHLNKAFVHGGVIGFEGQCMTIVPGKGPCLECIFEEVPEKGSIPTASTAGVLPMICGTIGALQAAECLKYLTGIGELLTGKMLMINALTMKVRTANFKSKREGCKACNK